jgi:hypothetical protein
VSSTAVRQHGTTPDSIRGGMERAAVDRQARTARLQDEFNATAKGDWGRAMYADWRARWPELRDCLRSKQRGSLSCKVRTLPSPGRPGNALMLELSGHGCQEKLKLRPAAVRGRPGLRVIRGPSRLN